MNSILYANNFLYTLSILSIATAAITKKSDLIIYYQIFLFYAIMLMYIYSSYKIKLSTEKYTLVYCAIIASCGILNLFKTFPSGIYTISSFLSALMIVLMGRRFFSPIIISDKIIIGFSFYVIISLFSGQNIETLLLHSKNYISIYTLFFLVCYFFECDGAEKKPNNFPIILTIIMSIISISSSGIIISALLIVLIFFSSTIRLKGVFATLLFSFLPILYFQSIFEVYTGLVAALLSYPEEAFKIFDIERLSGGDDRFAAWASYANEISISELVYGRIWPEKLSIFNSISLHNSLFQSHSMFGILGLVATLYWISAIIKLARFNWKISFLLFIWFIRGLADSTFLSGTYFDFLILAIPLLCLSSHTHKQDSHLG